MVQANPTSSVVVQRREQWTDGLLNAALFESREAATQVVLASQCDQDSCQFCDIGSIPPPSQPSGPAIVSKKGFSDRVSAPFFVTMTPKKL